ncbi:LysR family transcriptional regulator [Rhizorhabdus wittichii]|uniref:LysR family transcriptional regulator n=1 Tax=Rhizorhabdus wittichii TaxID=160791 RepID=UPI00037A1968|nr:LysR family transcriptional regulator [Rhizorhabdus wittichii]
MIKQLRYFVAAADFRSFRRAAQSVNLDQSTFGRHIRDLEYRLGVDLFERDRKGATLTPAGVEMLAKARRLVADADAMIAYGATLRTGNVGRLMLGFMTTISGGRLRDAFFEFNRATAGVELEGREASRDELFHELERGAVDFAIVTGQIEQEPFHRMPLWRERVLVAMPEEHGLAAKPAVTWEDLQQQLIIQTKIDPGPELCDMLIARLSEPGRRPQVRMQSVSHETVLNGIPGGHFLTLGYEVELQAHYPGVCVREIHEAGVPVTVGYSGYWHPGNDSPILAKFVDFLRERTRGEFAEAAHCHV